MTVGVGEWILLFVLPDLAEQSRRVNLLRYHIAYYVRMKDMCLFAPGPHGESYFKSYFLCIVHVMPDFWFSCRYYWSYSHFVLSACLAKIFIAVNTYEKMAEQELIHLAAQNFAMIACVLKMNLQHKWQHHSRIVHKIHWTFVRGKPSYCTFFVINTWKF